MNYNQLWSGNRGRSRSNRGCGRGRRGGANMHYRGGHSNFHRGGPPLLNTSDPFYNPGRFRGPQESYNHLYPHPMNQEPSWPIMRNRPPFTPNLRQAYLPATRVQPQIPNRSTSPLPGTEEYMQRNICEKSAFLKRELELEGPCFNNTSNNFDSSDGDYPSDNTNNNFCENTYQKNEGTEDDKPAQANESVPSPRRNKKQRQLSQRVMSVEEIHEKIINHISNLSHGKKMNLVNLPGPSGYDMAIQEITRQKRMELSKALRDICNNKFKETEDSSQVINAIIPDFDIKIEELPRELVEQLSSTLNENVTERIHNMCIDPELMFQQAAEILNNSLDLEKTVVQGDADKVDFSFPSFPSTEGSEGTDLGIQNIEDSSLGMAIEESMNQANMLNFQNSENSQSSQSQMNFDNSQSLNFNMTPSMNYETSQPGPTPYNMEFPDNADVNRDVLEDPALFIEKSNARVDVYSPNHESSNSSFIPDNSNLGNINPPFELMDIQEPSNILVAPSQDEVDAAQKLTADLMSEEAELTACLAQTNPDLNIPDINYTDQCLAADVNNEIIKQNDEPFESVNNSEDLKILLPDTNESQQQRDDEIEKLINTPSANENTDSLLQATVELEIALKQEEQCREKAEAVDNLEKTKQNPVKKKDKELSDSTKQAGELKKVEKEKLDSPKKKPPKEKRSKSKSKDNESQKKIVDDDQHEKRTTDKKTKSRYPEEEVSRISLEKDESHDRSDRRQTWDKYSASECSKEYTNDEDSTDRKRQDRRHDEKKGKGKYDEDYYRSKYDSYQQSYEDNYRKKYKDSSNDDDKHRRPDHSKNFDKYRELDSDLYHYSKYPAEVDDARSSKRYYQDKVSTYPYRQDYDYPYHKYEYPPSDYYQRQDSAYPPEEYDQKQHYSKSHKSKYKKHSKKHKRHRDHSSGSNASSSGSERNSSTSSNYKAKHTVKPPELYESSEEGTTARYPKTSLKERIQVLCNFKPDLISPKVTENVEASSTTDSVVNGSVMDDNATEQKEDFKIDIIIKEENVDVDQSVEKISKEKSDCEDELKSCCEIEALESKKYTQRPWKSPGEKKFMMEHLNQNPAQTEEDDRRADSEINSILVKNDLDGNLADSETSTNKIQTEDEHANTYNPQETHNTMYLNEAEISSPTIKELQDTDLNSREVSCTSESVSVKLTFKGNIPEITKEENTTKIINLPKKEILVTAYTQTDFDKEQSLKKNKKDSSKEKTRETHKEKLKSRQNSFTQTIVINATISTQTHKSADFNKNKSTQTDVLDNASTKSEDSIEILDGSISKPERRKRYIERMLEIDAEIEKLVKKRRAFYNLLIDIDLEKEIEAKPPIIAEPEEPKPKRPHKDRSRTSREAKALNIETSKPKQSSSPKNSPKPPSPQKLETKPQEMIPPPVKEKEPSSTHDTSKARSKVKRGRPKRHQDKVEAQVENIPEKVEEAPSDNLKTDINKKQIKEEPAKEAKSEVVKDVKPEVAKSKSTSKDKVESSRKRKSKEKVAEEHPKTVEEPKIIEHPSPKRHKPEPVQNEVKPVQQTPPEIKIESEPSPKSRKKDKKQETEKKIEETKKVEEDPPVLAKDTEVSVKEDDAPKEVEMTHVPEENKEKLNGSVPLEESIPVSIPMDVPVIEEPKLFLIPEVSSSTKKKKRRLSGLLDYRKKKKKSKNKNKKTAPAINPNIFSTKSAVNITRFSLTQLEEMRKEIRCKKILPELEQIEDDVKTEPPVQDSTLAHPEAAPDPSTAIDEGTSENLSSSQTVEVEEQGEESMEQTLDKEPFYTIRFKDFNGAILVIKVIGDIVLAASDKGQLLYFNMVNGDLIKAIDVSELAVTSLVVAKSKERDVVYVGSLDSCLSIVNFNSKEVMKQETLFEPIQCMEHSWGFIFVGSDRGSITRYDLGLDKVVDSLKVSNFNILMMRASQEGPRKVLIVAQRNSPVCVRDAISGLLLRTMQTSFSPTVYTLLIDKNLIYCGTSQHDILVYSFEDGQLVYQHEATKSKGVVCMQIAGSLLFAGCYNGNIYIYNTKNNAYLGTMTGPGGLMLSMEIVNDKIIVGTKSSNFKAWKIPQEYVESM